jgi:hypothetical protein
MPYGQLHDGFYDDPDLVRAGLEAKGLLASLISYSAKHLTNGFIPDTEIKVLGRPSRRPRRVLQRLVDVGAVTPVPDGWLMPAYLKHNRSADQVRADREANRKRQERLRGRRPEEATDSGSHAVSHGARSSPVPLLEDLSLPPETEALSSTAALGEEPPIEQESGTEVVVDLRDFDDVLDHDKRHLLHSICRSAPQFAKLKPAHLSRIEAEPHGGPVLLEALRSLAATEPGDLAAVRSPAKILDRRVVEVRAQMASRQRPQSDRESVATPTVKGERE